MTRLSTALLLATVATAALAPLPGLAQQAARPQAAGTVLEIPRDDQVVLELRAESWVETQTALVRASVDAAFGAGQGGDIRAQVLDALKKTSPEADWHLTAVDQIPDPAGLERWRVTAEARLKDGALSGIRDRAQGASRSGLKVQIDQVEYTPTVAEREATLAKLREQIYRDAKAELGRLNGLYDDAKWRPQRIDFLPPGSVAENYAPRAAKTMQMAAPAMAADIGGGVMEVAQKLTLRAVVVLGARR